MEEYKNAFVYPFSTPKNCYLYDVNTNTILKVNKEIFNFYKQTLSNLSQDSKNKIEVLVNEGFLKKNFIKKIEHTSTNFIKHFIERKTQGITLQVTQQCNLRCKYCVYSGQYDTRGHSKSSMSIDTAKKSVDYLIQHSSDLKEVNIAFYGGEPLLNFKLVKEVVSYTLKEYEGKRIIFNMTTNGTLFNDEILKFLEDNNFILLISLDGPKEIHDSNRVFAATGEGSFDTIMKNIRYIKEKYKKLYTRISFNAVLDPQLDPTCANEFFINTKEFEPNRVLSSMIANEYKKEQVTVPEDYIMLNRHDTYILYLHKIGRIGAEHVPPMSFAQFEHLKSIMFLMRTPARTLPEVFHPSGPCIPGARKLFVDTFGDFYPCERTSENSTSSKIGTLEAGIDFDKVLKILNIGKLTEKQCKSCWAIRFCQQCFTQADDMSSLSKEKRLSGCPSNRYFAEETLKDFCTLIEYGYVFDHENFSVFDYNEVL